MIINGETSYAPKNSIVVECRVCHAVYRASNYDKSKLQVRDIVWLDYKMGTELFYNI